MTPAETDSGNVSPENATGGAALVAMTRLPAAVASESALPSVPKRHSAGELMPVGK